MKNFVKSMVVVSALTVAGSASAHWMDCVTPVIGLDYYQVFMRAKSGYNYLFTKSGYPGLTAYIGARFANCWGFEIGYDTSVRFTRNFIVTDAGLFATTSTVSGTSKSRRSGGHIDVIGYLPIECFDRFELFGSFGYGYVKPKVTVTTNGNTGVLGQSYAASVQSVIGKGKSVVRLGIGANYMLTDCVGIRAKVGFESTSSLKVTGNVLTTYNNKPFRNSGTFALGAFSKF